MSTIRVLSLDGGGMRGYISAVFLQLFVQQWGINPNEIWKYFDIIAGSSIGGIQALAYAFGLSPTDTQEFFLDDGPWIFTTSTTTPSVKPSTLSKANTILGGPYSNPTFYPSTTPNIGTMRLNSKLLTVFQDNILQAMKTNVLITSFEKNDADPDFEQYTNTPVYFSNLSDSVAPILSGQNLQAVDVAMATSAAPLYFPAWNIGADSYIDGGVTQNNPSSMALTIAKALKPVANRFCVLSIGTGLGEVGFPPESNLKAELKAFRANPELFAVQYHLSEQELQRLKTLDSIGALEGVYLIMYLLGAMTAGPQETIAKELEIEADYTLDNLYQYRMQYYLDPNQDTELDTSTPDILKYYQESATEYFNNDIENITNFIARLDA